MGEIIMTENEWTSKISKLLIGRKIIKVEYMNENEMNEQGWYKRPLCIKLDNGIWLTPTQDDEGNDGGSIYTNDDNLPIIPVI